VIELRFHEDLYDGASVEEATKAFAELADVTLEREGAAFVARVSALPVAADEGIDEVTLSAELANYALGCSIERARAAGAVS
jgi:hypothetical protein